MPTILNPFTGDLILIPASTPAPPTPPYTVSTTDATVTTIATIPTVSDAVYIITTTVTGRRTGGSSGSTDDGAAFQRTAMIKNVAGTVSIENLQTGYTAKDQLTWDSTMSVSGTNIIVTVQGDVNNNVNWNATLTVSSMV